MNYLHRASLLEPLFLKQKCPLKFRNFLVKPFKSRAVTCRLNSSKNEIGSRVQNLVKIKTLGLDATVLYDESCQGFHVYQNLNVRITNRVTARLLNGFTENC